MQEAASLALSENSWPVYPPTTSSLRRPCNHPADSRRLESIAESLPLFPSGNVPASIPRNPGIPTAPDSSRHSSERIGDEDFLRSAWLIPAERLQRAIDNAGSPNAHDDHIDANTKVSRLPGETGHHRPLELQSRSGAAGPPPIHAARVRSERRIKPKNDEKEVIVRSSGTLHQPHCRPWFCSSSHFIKGSK